MTCSQWFWYAKRDQGTREFVNGLQGTQKPPKNLSMQLDKLAEAHLRDARQLRELGIAQTKKGLLNLTYDRASRTYTLKQFNGSGIVLASGRKGVVKTELTKHYLIEH